MKNRLSFKITEVYDNLYEDHSYVRSYLAKTFAIALPAYLTLGILGYVVLGNRVEQVITQNLGVDQEFELVINFLVVCMILFGYPGMAYPGQKVLEQWCYKICMFSTISKFLIFLSQTKFFHLFSTKNFCDNLISNSKIKLNFDTSV